MKNLILSFKSRNELYAFARILKSNSVFFNIINSPTSIASSCTLSIKTNINFLNTIKQLLLRHQPRSFIGLYSIQTTINGYGNLAVSGNSAAANIEGFGYTITNAIYVSIMTIVGQNYGAKKYERIPRIMLVAVATSFMSCSSVKK